MLIRFSKSSMSFLDKLPKKQFLQVHDAVQALGTTPYPHNAVKLKFSREKIFMRLAVGEYRVIYHVAEDEVEICLIDKRNGGKIYKEAQKMK